MSSVQLIERVKGVVLPLEGEFLKSLSDQSISFARESAFALQALQKNGFLLSAAASNQPSLKNAIINVAAIGISLNPAAKLAYLVPRDKGVCLDISYLGLMHIAQQTGAIKWCQAAIVRRNDQFRRHGIDKAPEHVYEDFAPEEERGDIVGVYCTVKTEDGDYLTHSMRIKDALAIRDRSAAWKAFLNKKKSCPWVTDEEQMILKTCVKQGSKYWPRRDKLERLDRAIEYLNTELDEGINFAAESQQGPKDVTPISDATLNQIGIMLKQAGKSEADIVGETIPRLIGRTIDAIPDLTEEEARKLIGFIQKRIDADQRAKASQGAA